MNERAATALKRGRQKVIDEVGPWTAHNIHLGEGVFTIGNRVVGQETRLAPMLQIAGDALGGIEGRTVLDLACMEGLFAVEFARHGAKVLGVEGRAGHVARANFARDSIGLPQLEFVQGDVRDIDPEREGRFDLVLALGILYHLDAADLFDFVRRVADLTGRAAIVDTHYAMRPKDEWSDGEATYHGISVREHDPGDTDEERESAAGSSLDNLQSAWLTKPSLFNLLAESGFTTVSEVRVPLTYANWDRVVLLALKGAPVGKPISAPQVDSGEERFSEDGRVRLSPQQSGRGRLMRKAPSLLPGPIRKAVLNRRRKRQREAPS